MLWALSQLHATRADADAAAARYDRFLRNEAPETRWPGSDDPRTEDDALDLLHQVRAGRTFAFTLASRACARLAS